MRKSLFPLAFVGIVPALLCACSLGQSDVSEQQYRATIRRTSFGIPHIEAADLASLGFGEGYAFARDHLCSLADQVVYARGERARYFGRGEDDRHLASDVTMKALRVREQAEREAQEMQGEHREWIEGYVAGYNLFLSEVGVDGVDGWCRGEAWVEEITPADVLAYRRVVGLMAPRFAGMIAGARPPGEDAPPPTARHLPEAPFEDWASAMASNGWAIGSERSESGGGMLVANPHYPWEGSNRFWEKHLTIPGRLDGYGVGLLGIPGIAIGFNENVAWTHTVSAGQRFTLYRLELSPDDPTTYLYDGERREMDERRVEVSVRQQDGGLQSLERSVYFTHYGPVLDWPGMPWTRERAITYRDANEANDESLVTYLAMIQASSMEEFQEAHREHQGILFVNTIAASSDGRAWYGDVSAAPLLSEETIAAWRERMESDEATRRLYQERGILLFDGRDPRFEWSEDERARDPGVVPFDEVPQLERRDYVLNANDSYWLSHHEARLEGFSPAHGPEDTARSLRTRQNLSTLSDTSPEGPMGEDGRFSLDELAAAALSNESYTASVLREPLVERCRDAARESGAAQGGAASASERPLEEAEAREEEILARESVEADLTREIEEETLELDEVALEPACEALASWDGKLDLESRGAVLFREWITQYDGGDLRRAGALFAVPFDPKSPLDTPRGLAEGELAIENLRRAVRILEEAGLALDVPLGEVQYSYKPRFGGGEGRIPIHGGQGGYEGVENVAFYSPNRTTLEPAPEPAPEIEGSRFLTRDGYPISYGTSFIMALEFTEDGPRAQAFLTYGESGAYDSPHFDDQTGLFSRKAWRPILYRSEDVQADPELEEMTVSAPRG